MLRNSQDRLKRSLSKPSPSLVLAVSASVAAMVALPVLSSTSSDSQYRRVATRKTLVTGYCPCKVCCGKSANGVTSTGRNAFRFTGVAADPKAIPYGNFVRIPGVGFRKVDDTGGAMRQSWRKKGVYHLDLRFRSHEEARQWGRKWMKVDVYKPLF
ncbi:MAG: 3D domain-containing protein [Planctomycetota bacterium]|jgi:3D (Asp-Asp-Asp) domain-containing protein|nr:3D domain-containing protein [Planctomycetota bacterium]MDP7249099.1 3D domain-containing protein [Planctomycetota bacterium]